MICTDGLHIYKKRTQHEHTRTGKLSESGFVHTYMTNMNIQNTELDTGQHISVLCTARPPSATDRPAAPAWALTASQSRPILHTGRCQAGRGRRPAGACARRDAHHRAAAPKLSRAPIETRTSRRGKHHIYNLHAYLYIYIHLYTYIWSARACARRHAHHRAAAPKLGRAPIETRTSRRGKHHI